MAEKSLRVDLRSRRKNYRVQVFKTVQGVHGWTGPFDVGFAAYCCGFIVPASCVFYITCHFSKRSWFQVSTECSECSVVLHSGINTALG